MRDQVWQKRHSRSKAVLLGFLIMLSCASVFPVWGFSGGDGSASNPYLIANTNELLDINLYYKNKHFKLISDIDLSAFIWPASVISHELGPGAPVIGENFVGTFDGNGHTIRNLIIVAPKAYNVGLFEGIWASEVKNLTLENITIIGGEHNESIGILAGKTWWTTIRNCHVKDCTIAGWNVNATIPDENAYIGGIVGHNDNSDIENCSVTNLTITAPDNCDYHCGGLAGNLSNDSQVRFCYTRDCTITGGTYAGGLVGLLTDRSTDTYGSYEHNPAGVRDSYSYGGTIYDCPNAGGLVGRRIQYHNEAAYVHRCYSTTYPVGGYGLIGMNSQYGSGNVVNNFWNTDTSYTYVDCGGYGNLPGATGITNSQMAQQGTFSGWNFSSIWQMDSTDSQVRPMLQSNPEAEYYFVDISAGANGSVSPDGANWHIEGTDITVEALASFGYVVDKWYVGGNVAQVGGLTYQTGPILTDITIEVTFKTSGAVCEVAVSSGPNGFTLPLTGTSYIERGEELVIHAYPDDGYEVDYWELDGSVYQYGSNTFTLYGTQTNTSNVSVNVVFEPILYSVHIDTGIPVGNGDLRVGEHGTVSPVGYQSIQEKSTLSITATADTGYEVAAWQVNGVLCGHGLSTYTIDSVEQDLEINVLFKNTVFTYGLGTENDPYPVYDAASLGAAGDDLAACYYLTQDIDLAYAEYNDPILGSLGSPFLGTFDGNGFSIKRLNIYSSGDYLGLFGVLASQDGLQAVVKNLTLEDTIIDGLGSAIGALCGQNQSGIIEKCRVTGADVQGDNRVALLCGYNNSVIRNCSAEGTASGNYRVGLLTGNTYNGTLEDCYAIGQVAMFGTGAQAAGGISGDSNSSSITRTFASCTITGEGTNLGSFCGWAQGTLFDNCYTNQESFEVLLGGSGGGNSGTVTGATLLQMQSLEFWALTEFDFVFDETDGMDDTWRLCPDTVDFPRLRWQFNKADFVCGDGVDLLDFAAAAKTWMFNQNDPAYHEPYDLNGDGIIDLSDLEIFGSNWLE